MASSSTMAFTPACGAMGKLRAQYRSRVSAIFSGIPTKRFQRLRLSCNAEKINQVEVRGVKTAEINQAEILGVKTNQVEVLGVKTAQEAEEQPSSLTQLHTLLTEICESGIAEVGLKMGPDMTLRVKRSVSRAETTPAAAAAAAAALPQTQASASPSTAATSPTQAQAPAKAKPSQLKISPLMSKAVVYEELQNAAAESGFVFITSPKVGVFRRAKFLKGAFGRPSCNEGDSVKEGQVVCYLEQLGTQSAVEADVSGQVEKILFQDGVPVGYADPLIMIKPHNA